MPIPKRDDATKFHFHVYDFAGSAPFTLSAQPQYAGMCFYSLLQDLTGLVTEGNARNVPHIQLLPYGRAITTDGKTFRTLVLSFGGSAATDPAVVLTGGIHAREWVSPEVVYLIAEYLVRNYHSGPVAGLNDYQKFIRNLVDNRRIHIIPMLNPAGNSYTVYSIQTNARDWRKNRVKLPTTRERWGTALTGSDGQPNRPFANVVVPTDAHNTDASYDVPRYDPDHGIPPLDAKFDTETLVDGYTGVDLNRNLPTEAFGYDTLTPMEDGSYQRRNYYPKNSSYFGPKGGREVENRNLMLYLQGVQGLATSIDYHSFAQMVLYPTEQAHRGRASGAGYALLGRVLGRLTRYPQAQEYQLGTPIGLVGYDATGSVPDYLAQTYHVRAYTIELDPAHRTKQGFELPEGKICEAFEKNIRGALAAIAAPAATVQRRKQSIHATEAALLAWNVVGQGNRLPGEQ